MKNFNFIDYMYIFSLFSIWLLLLVNIILAVSGYLLYSKTKDKKVQVLETDELPFVSVIVPAHNEGKVIYNTVKSLIFLNYPKEKYEIIIVNDNSSDNTSSEIIRARDEFLAINVRIIETDEITGGKGKSNALNIAYKNSSSEIIAVYDADNTVESNALLYLVSELKGNGNLGAAIGKFRTRNKKVNLLTKFINIETLSFQWMSQGGRWNLLGLCSIPGTNFVIRRSILDEIGGWDEDAISEDTEISFRIYKLGYKISFMPKAITWEQEPETLKVWFKQRTRWAKGNLYVLKKHILSVFEKNSSRVRFDICYFFCVYFFFFLAVIISDLIFVANIFFDIQINVSGNFIILWILAYILFILEIYVTLSIERGETNLENLLIVPIMYFTYCQMWILVIIKSSFEFIKDIIFKREIKWYKTERF